MAQPEASRWAPAGWLPHFSHRRQLLRELTLLERLFPDDWCDATFPSSKAVTRTMQWPPHQLRGDLLTVGGRTRVLDLAAELLRLMADPHCRASAGGRIPMQGRLRNSRLYPPTKSELLVAPILRPLGKMTWQPAGAGFGADYGVVYESGAIVAEVKRAETAKRDALATERRVRALFGPPAVPPRDGFLFTRAETDAREREDARRLYPHVRKAARQLRKSARRLGRRGSVPGILFLDLDGNNLLVNLRERVVRWMSLPWAAPIDLVMWFDYRERDARWGTVAEPLYCRTKRALDRLYRFHRPCTQWHVHIRSRPRGACPFQLPF
jgi:hypothetical protein